MPEVPSVPGVLGPKASATAGVERLADRTTATFAPDGNFRWMPSIAMDHVGDIAVGYSDSSPTVDPSIRYTGRTPSDPLGTMKSETAIVAGGGVQRNTGHRWGDYSSMSIDPSDDCTFWYTQEYIQTSGSFNWSTRLAAFKFSGCS